MSILIPESGQAPRCCCFVPALLISHCLVSKEFLGLVTDFRPPVSFPARIEVRCTTELPSWLRFQLQKKKNCSLFRPARSQQCSRNKQFVVGEPCLLGFWCDSLSSTGALQPVLSQRHSSFFLSHAILPSFYFFFLCVAWFTICCPPWKQSWLTTHGSLLKQQSKFTKKKKEQKYITAPQYPMTV